MHLLISLLSCTCGCYRLCAISDCIISIRHFGFYRRDATFIYVLTTQTSKVYTIKYKILNQLSSIYYITEVICFLITIVTSNVL